jgi:indolepyruvate ferredoxin oxidoreductase beta subunit
MNCDIILAGVGGQGILTIAQAISIAAVRRGWSVKQAETHGMAQRGGAVQSHLRIADHELYSDLISHGTADMILAVEPLEALRYLAFLSERGTVVSSTVPMVNINDYPSIEAILERITKLPHHILVDADRLARAAGSGRAVNIVMLGAASALIGLNSAEIEAALQEMFERKGELVVAVNQRASRFGRSAATAYLDGLQRGGAPLDVRHWIESLPAEALAGDGDSGTFETTSPPAGCELSTAEQHAVGQMLDQVAQDGRRQLYEHEVYRLVELVGAISPPRHRFISTGQTISKDLLERFPGEKVVLKVVSPDIIHKSEAGAVVFVAKDADTVSREIARLTDRQTSAGAKVEGVLVVEYVARGASGFGQELFVGIRSTREFGAIIAAGLGGVDTEFLASKMRPGEAVAKALAVDTSPEAFLERFKQTAAYEVLAGRARGHHRVVSDGELLRCFRAFLAVARRFCVDRGQEGPDLSELEVNPFAFSRQRMIPLDGRGRLGKATIVPPRRPTHKVEQLLEPRSIALLGVSSKATGFGRIILQNILSCGFPSDHLYVIKQQADAVDGVRCVPTIDELPEKVDLLVVATGSDSAPRLIDQAIQSRKIGSVILISGGIGETEGTEGIEERVVHAIRAARGRADEGPIVLGGNCLGVRSRPGRYDTFFVPKTKMSTPHHATPSRCALISQSGAFIISRLSNLELLDPTLAVSLGNQIDLTVSDILRTVGARDDIDCVGVYVEGFADMDGLTFVRAVAEVAAAGKVVVFYKAGRTAPGRAATAGHTHSVAGDYDVCQTAVAHAGAVVTDTFKEFEQLMELCTGLHHKAVNGRRIGIISNAGFETVGAADAIRGTRYQLDIPALSEATEAAVRATLAAASLDKLVNVRNPLDLTPMAGESVYMGCTKAMLEDDGIDAVVVSCVPLTPQLLTTPEETAQDGALARQLQSLFRESTKPFIAVVDSGSRYEPMVRMLREGGVPTFRSCDQAVRSLGRYLCHRSDGTAARHLGDSAAAATAKTRSSRPPNPRIGSDTCAAGVQQPVEQG